MPSGQTRQNDQNSGEEFISCRALTFPTASPQPHPSFDSDPNGPEFKTKRSPLDVKGPAHTWFSHQVAQPCRPPDRIESATLSYV